MCDVRTICTNLDCKGFPGPRSASSSHWNFRRLWCSRRWYSTTSFGIYDINIACVKVLGFIFGAMFIQWVTYRWIFWLVGLVALVVGLSSAVVIPAHLANTQNSQKEFIPTWRDLDVVGASILTGMARSRPSIIH